VTTERWVLLGLAPARAEWFRDVTRWVSSAAVPAEFVKCMSAEEVRARLTSGRSWSALLVDASASGFDRDLVAAALAWRTPVLVVAEDPTVLPWSAADLGVAAVLPATFGREELVEVLVAHAAPIGNADALPAPFGDPPPVVWKGRFVVVCGPGGTGASTIAVAAAQGLAGDVRYGRGVVLADLALRADQAMLHDAVDLGPGLQELVESHRLGQPDRAEVGAHTFEVPSRGYRLVLGLRRPEAWAALRPRAVEAALDSLRRCFPLVVADVTGDLEGAAEGGSADVEERNHAARASVRQADVVLAVGAPGLKGIHSLAALLGAIATIGVDPGRVLPVINRAPRDPRARTELSRALAVLAPDASGLASPVWVRERKLEPAWRDGTPLPAAVVEPVTEAITACLDRRRPRPARPLTPERIAPGSIGVWGAD